MTKKVNKWSLSNSGLSSLKWAFGTIGLVIAPIAAAIFIIWLRGESFNLASLLVRYSIEMSAIVIVVTLFMDYYLTPRDKRYLNNDSILIGGTVLVLAISLLSFGVVLQSDIAIYLDTTLLPADLPSVLNVTEKVEPSTVGLHYGRYFGVTTFVIFVAVGVGMYMNAMKRMYEIENKEEVYPDVV